MIDVHCLIHKESPYTNLILDQMFHERDITFHLIPNGINIGLGRMTGFMTGTAPYVSYVDYDDLIVTGIFSKINDVMNTGIDWCYTDEMLIDENGNNIQSGWSNHPELYKDNILNFVRLNRHEHVHHIVTFKRELITPKMYYIMSQLNELPEEYLRTELSTRSHKHINEVGYYWRQHPDNSMKKYKCYRDGVSK